ncbi:MAG: CcdB family protein [Caulobacterales bacterium]|nr:CcdB family protein [Caulobacterales bacterium]
MIRQFEVFATPESRGASAAPLICVLQSHHLEALNTVIVAPMLIATSLPTSSQAAVPIILDGVDYLLDLTLMAHFERRALRSVVASLADHEDDIRHALDRLFTGF